MSAHLEAGTGATVSDAILVARGYSAFRCCGVGIEVI